MKDNNFLGENVSVEDFLAVFFPEPDKRIFLRTFKAKNAPQDNPTARSYKTTLANFPKLKTELQNVNKKHGIYFVVNSGGNSKSDITRFNAAFVENDNLPIEQQHKNLDTAPILPSIRVETKKSVHAYWLLDGDCSKDDWSEIQNRLIAYFDGDTAIKDASRVMRLPCFNHVSYDKDSKIHSYKQVEIREFEPKRRYTIKELLEAFPEAPQPAIKTERVNANLQNGELPEWYRELQEEIQRHIYRRERDGLTFKCPVHNGQAPNSAILFNNGKVFCRSKKCKPEEMARAFSIDVDALKKKYIQEKKQKNKIDFDRGNFMEIEEENTDSTNSTNSTDSAVSSQKMKMIPQLKEKALHGIAGWIVKAIAKESEASEAALLVQFLTAFGSAVGFKPFCWTEADKQGTNLFTLIVGKTARAGRKGTSWGNIERLFAEADENWTTDCLESNFLASGEGLINRLKDAKNGEHSGVIDKRLLLVEGEFGKVLNIMKRSGESLNSTLRNAFDRKTLGNGRSNEFDSKKATNPHVSMIGHITQNELKALLNDVEVHNGFLNRYLIAATERKQKLALGGNFWREDYSQYVEALRGALEFGKTVDGEIRLSKDAEDLWREIYDSYDEEEDGYIDAMTARGEAIMRRLQLIYALLDKSEMVEVAHVEAAKAVWDYCEASVRYIFANGQRLSKDADKLYKALKGNTDGLNRTQQFDLFKKAKRITADVLDKLNDELCKADLAEVKEVPTSGRNEKVLFDVEIHKSGSESVEFDELNELNEFDELKTYTASS